MLDIHELVRNLPLESGGVRLPGFSALPRLSRVGRFEGIFWGGVAGAGVEDGEAVLGTEGVCFGAGAGAFSRSGYSFLRSSWWGRVGSPPCEDVFGGASRVRPGDDGACWRWWWSAPLVRLTSSGSLRIAAVEPQGKRVSPLVEWCSHETSTP